MHDPKEKENAAVSIRLTLPALIVVVIFVLLVADVLTVDDVGSVFSQVPDGWR